MHTVRPQTQAGTKSDLRHTHRQIKYTHSITEGQGIRVQGQATSTGRSETHKIHPEATGTQQTRNPHRVTGRQVKLAHSQTTNTDRHKIRPQASTVRENTHVGSRWGRQYTYTVRPPAQSDQRHSQTRDTHTGPQPGRPYRYTVGLQRNINMESGQTSAVHRKVNLTHGP